MGRYTKIRETTFDEIQLNAGVLTDNFDPETGTLELESIIAATSGGFKFSDNVSYRDNGEDIDNCPKNMKELKEVDNREVTASGNFITATKDSVKLLVGGADIDTDKIVPRDNLKSEDFKELWWVGDYSSKTGETKGGCIAIHMMNTLNAGGFQLQTTDKGKGQFAFNFMAHYSMSEQTKVPYEVYVKVGKDESPEALMSNLIPEESEVE